MAFGMLGDIETAFLLADECPTDQGSKYDDYMLSSLLIACNSHKESGFQLALSVSYHFQYVVVEFLSREVESFLRPTYFIDRLCLSLGFNSVQGFI